MSDHHDTIAVPHDLLMRLAAALEIDLRQDTEDITRRYRLNTEVRSQLGLGPIKLTFDVEDDAASIPKR
jgi:hypothetical protein